jgi:hypothetical protein
MASVPGIAKAPVYGSDRSLLARRVSYDFRDYGFEIAIGLNEIFEIVPTRLTDEEAFLFFFSREDVASDHWALFNLHVFLKRTGSLEDFAHSLGESVKTVALSPVTAFHKAALGYTRAITMGELFKGGEPVIAFIGGDPGRMVRDSHFYFMHHHAHCYTGVIHLPGEETRYDTLRSVLFDGVKFVD